LDSKVNHLNFFENLHKIYKYFGKIIRIPDSRILWLPAAILTTIKISRKNKYDAIYATGPTFSNLIVGVVIKFILKKPLITDFRDAWIADPMLPLNKKYEKVLHEKLEKFTIFNSDRIITTNPFVTSDFKKRYGSDTKFDTIYNGYDIDDFHPIKKYNKKIYNKFKILYTGRLYGERTPKFFLKAVQLAVEKKPEMKEKLQIIFVGSCEKYLDGKYIEDYIEENKLNDLVKLTGHISRKASLQYQAEADVLLLLIGIVSKEKELTYGLSGKVFDYMLSAKPILTVANGGATREFIVKNKIGDIFYHEDINGIKNYLIEAYNNWQEGLSVSISNYNAAYDQFNFRSLTKKLADHLFAITQ
jgi:glycosyltransferase involved in cell wall biosynthesis